MVKIPFLLSKTKVLVFYLSVYCAEWTIIARQAVLRLAQMNIGIQVMSENAASSILAILQVQAIKNGTCLNSVSTSR